MTRIHADFARTKIPENLQIGDRLTIHGTAHVTGIVAEHLDVTCFGEDTTLVQGERTVTFILEATFEKIA